MHLKRLFFITIFFLLRACEQSHAVPRGFTEFPLRVDGKIIDYLITDINDDSKNDIVVLFHAKGTSSVAIFLQSSSGFSYDPNQEIQLSSNTFAIDVAPVLGNNVKGLCMLTTDGVVAIPFSNGRFKTEKPRTIIQSTFSNPGFSSHSLLLPMHFYNKIIGKNILVIPRDGNLILFEQEKNGKFTESNSLTSSQRVSLFGPMKIETQKGERTFDGMYLNDLNNDGRIDICCVHSKGCSYFLQNEDGSFTSTPTASIPYTEDDNTRLLSLADCNGDAIPDLVFENHVKTNFLSNKRTTIGIYFGTRYNDRVQYNANADKQWVFSGVHVTPIIADYNSDGIADLVVMKATMSLGNLVSSLIGGKTKLQIEFYKSNHGDFSQTPEAIRETTLSGKIYDDPDFTPLVSFGDITGDGKRDFILGEESAIFCYPAVQNRLFDNTSNKSIDIIPSTITGIDMYKIDNDNREDICLVERKQNLGIIHIYLTR